MAYKKVTMSRLDQSVIDNMGGGGSGGVGPPGPAGVDGKTWYVSVSNPDNALGVIGDLHLNTSTFDVREKTGASTWTLRGNIKGEQGIQGIQGVQGIQGIQGPPGTNGTNGINGKTWHSGTSNPNGSLGAVGDFHLNTSSWDVREKTGTSTWTLRGNIKGIQGEQGIQGIQGIQGPPGLATSTIESRTSDPINPEVGRIWIRSDL